MKITFFGIISYKGWSAQNKEVGAEFLSLEFADFVEVLQRPMTETHGSLYQTPQF